MFGSTQYISILTSEHPDNPVKEDIGEKDIAKIVDVIIDEYWREYIFLLQYSDAGSIFLDHLGSWRVKNSSLRKYIRECLKEMRKLRKHPNYKNPESIYCAKYLDLERKLGYAWKQLNGIRKLWIMRNEAYNTKKLIKAQNNNIV